MTLSNNSTAGTDLVILLNMPYTAAAEALKKCNSGCARGEKSGRGLVPCPIMEVCGCHPRKILENIDANLCNFVHFWQPVQQKMYNSVFNLDFGRSIWWHQVIKVAWKIDAFPCHFKKWQGIYRPCRIGSAAAGSCNETSWHKACTAGGKTLQTSFHARTEETKRRAAKERQHNNNNNQPPYHNITPLVEFDGQVTMRLHPLGIWRIHHRLACWTHGYRLRKFRLTRPRNPSHLQTTKTFGHCFW